MGDNIARSELSVSAALTLNLILAQLGTHKSRLVGTELWSSVSCGEAQKPDLILVFPQLE